MGIYTAAARRRAGRPATALLERSVAGLACPYVRSGQPLRPGPDDAGATCATPRTSSTTRTSRRAQRRAAATRRPSSASRSDQARLLRVLRERDGGDAAASRHPGARRLRLPRPAPSRGADSVEVVGGGWPTGGSRSTSRAIGWVEFDPTAAASASRRPSRAAPPARRRPRRPRSLRAVPRRDGAGPAARAARRRGPTDTGIGPFIAIALILLVGVVALGFAAMRRAPRQPMHPDQAWGSRRGSRRDSASGRARRRRSTSTPARWVTRCRRPASS